MPSYTHKGLSSPSAGSSLPIRHSGKQSAVRYHKRRKACQLFPTHGKLLWKLMLKEQDSSTVCLDSSC